MRPGRSIRLALALAVAAAAVTGTRAETFATRLDCGVGHELHSGLEMPDGTLRTVGRVLTPDTQALVIDVGADGRFRDGRVLAPATDASLGAIASLADGSLVFAGGWWPRVFVMRTDPDLTPRWHVAIGHATESLGALTVLRDGSILVSGSHNDPTGDIGGSHVFAARLSPDGVVLWHERYVMTVGSGTGRVIESADGSLLLLCSAQPTPGARATVLLQLDAGGGVVAARHLVDDAGAGLAPLDMAVIDGELVVVGNRYPASQPTRPFVARLSLDLSAKWAVEQPTGFPPTYQSIAGSSCDTLIVTGFASDSSHGLGCYVAHLDPDGQVLEQWAYSDTFEFGSFGFTRPFAVSGGLAILGTSAPTGDPKKGQVIRMTPSGELGSACATWAPRAPATADFAIHVEPVPVTRFPELSPPEALVQAWTPLSCTTTDRCRSASDPPWGVRPSEVAREAGAALRFTSRTRLEWEDGARTCSDAFDVYRTPIRRLAVGDYGRCIGTVSAPWIEDPQLPGLITGYAYLVSGRSAGGRGPLGLDSRRTTRSPATTCP